MTAKLAAALVAFQAAAPVIPKNRTAKIPTKSGPGYSYKYADLSDMLAAIRQPLRDNGLAVTQMLCAASPGCMAIRTTIWHESGESTTDCFEFGAAGKSPQEIGSLVTYMRRYALGSALSLATDEDDDGNAATHAEPRKAKPKAAEPPEDPVATAKAELWALAQGKGLTADELAAMFANDHGTDIRTADADTIRAFAKGLAGE